MSKQKKIAVLGAGGQLGSELKKLISSNSDLDFSFFTFKDLDITSKKDVDAFFNAKDWSAIINCAAYTAVDRAESEEKKAFAVNGKAVKYLGLKSHQKKTGLFHISTDFVFDGKKNTPYLEKDKTNSLSVYGKSKEAGEKALMSANPNAIIIRTSWLYSMYSSNFLQSMMKLGKEKPELNVVYDQIGTPTYAPELGNLILKILNRNLEKEMRGIFHFSNEGVCSWYDFAWKIMRNLNLNCKVYPIRTEQYPTPAQRPAYSVLDKKKIKDFLGISIPHWEESLYNCTETIKKA